MSISTYIAERSVMDHHCHGVVRVGLTWPLFTSLLTEGDTAHAGVELHSPLGLAIRSLCAPILDLERHCAPETYWQRRADIGNAEATRRFLAATGIGEYIVDTGYRGSELTTPEELGELANQPSTAILRLETLAESIVQEFTAEQFPDAFRAALVNGAASHVGFKSVMAYRYGLDFDPEPPTDAEVVAACSDWHRQIAETGNDRISHPVLLRFLLWQAVDQRKPIQMHIGYGDGDITLYRCDPSQMTAFLRATQDSGASIVLLHCYPYVRQAAILCQVFPHVYMDTSLGVVHAGAGSLSIIRESMEMVPFSRNLFATDAFGLAELYLIGTHFWRVGMTRVLTDWLDADAISMADAERLIDDIGWNNAAHLYGIGGETHER